MSGQKKDGVSKKFIWIAVVILLIGVVLSAIVLFGSMHRTPDDKDAIALVPSDEELEGAEDSQNSQEGGTVDDFTKDQDIDKEQADDSQTVAEDGDAASQDSAEGEVFVAKPSYSVYDGEGVWTNSRAYSIFTISSVNGENVVSVASDNGDKVIAPGTTNEYVFYLKNTGNCALDYTLTVDAYYSQEDLDIPVNVRMTDYRGDWELGNDDEWVPVMKLNEVEDSATLGVNRSAYYTLQWEWPYESGDDVHDTDLGNRTIEEDVSLTIVINTIAKMSDGAGDGVQTGDDANIMPLVIIMAAAVVLIVVAFVILGKKRKTQEDEELNEEKKQKE